MLRWWNDFIYILWNLVMVFVSSFGESYIMIMSSVWSENIGEKSCELCLRKCETVTWLFIL